MAEPRQDWVPEASWLSMGGAVQGGLVTGRLLQAVGTEGVRAATVHLLQRVVADVPAQVQVQPDRKGLVSSFRVELHQQGKLVAVAQVLVVPPAHASVSPLHASAGVEDVGTPGNGVPFDDIADFPPFARHMEILALGSDVPLGRGPQARLQAWLRLRSKVALPPLVQLAVLADALPPSSFAVLAAPVLLPTVEFTLHLAGPLPATGEWVRLNQRTAWASAEAVVDDAVVHDEQGELVARVRQTRRVVPVRRLAAE